MTTSFGVIFSGFLKTSAKCVFLKLGIKPFNELSVYHVNNKPRISVALSGYPTITE